MTVETKISTYLSFHNVITETRSNILNLPQGLIKTTLIYGILRLTKKKYNDISHRLLRFLVTFAFISHRLLACCQTTCISLGHQSKVKAIMCSFIWPHLWPFRTKHKLLLGRIPYLSFCSVGHVRLWPNDYPPHELPSKILTV